MQIIGQDELLNEIEYYVSNNRFPKSSLIVGECGSGKHTIAKYVAERLHVEYVDITSNLCVDDLADIILSPTQHLLVIDMSLMDDRKSNSILKFVEEPPEYDYIMLLCDIQCTLMQTLNNRCIHFYIKPYKTDILEKFIPDECATKEFILKYSKTPGDVQKYLPYRKEMIDDLNDIVCKITTKLDKAPMFNIFNISKKMCLKKDSAGYDVNLFFNMLIDKYICLLASGEFSNFNTIRTVYSYASAIKNSAYNKEYLFDNFLIALKRSLQ